MGNKRRLFLFILILTSVVIGSQYLIEVHADDSYEDNDTWDDAKQLNFHGVFADGTWAYDNGLVGGDLDYYKVYLDFLGAGGCSRIIVRLNMTLLPNDLRLTVYDSDTTPIRELVKFDVQIDSNETYWWIIDVCYSVSTSEPIVYIKVDIPSAEVYSLNVKIWEYYTGGCCTCDPDLAEENDMRTQAADIPTCGCFTYDYDTKDLDYYRYWSDNLSSGDNDWFNITIEETVCEVKVNYFADYGQDLAFCLYNASGDCLVEWAFQYTKDTSLFLYNHTGILYIRIQGFLCFEYNLYVWCYWNCSDRGRFDDNFEENDIALTAKAIPVGIHLGLYIFPGDDDWYNLSLNPGDRIDVELYTSAVMNLDLFLYASDGQTLLNASTVSWEFESISYIASEAEIVLIKVNVSAHLESFYKMHLMLTEAPPNDGGIPGFLSIFAILAILGISILFYKEMAPS
jgi:hypothetical protein